ncbi:MAG TPA: DUF3592 domain-containing protein [Chroococcales cyanobacterium]|jgi:hypothetical protein
MPSNPSQPAIDREQEIANAVWLNLYGLILAGAGWYVHKKEQYEHSHFKQVKGTIVGSVQHRKQNTLTDYEYAPVIEFMDNGKKIQFNRIPYESFARSTGTEVIVRYDPQFPQTSAYILDPWNDLLVWLPFVMAGLAFIGGLHALLKLLRARVG